MKFFESFESVQTFDLEICCGRYTVEAIDNEEGLYRAYLNLFGGKRLELITDYIPAIRDFLYLLAKAL